MAQYEWPTLPTMIDAPRPGIHNMDGSPYTDVGVFPIASGALRENSSGSFAYYPYDRIAFATLAGEDWTNTGFSEWGAYLYHQNQIRKNTGTDWPVIHAVASQQNLLDFGIHTGLYTVWGTDGKAYLVGMYPGAGAGEVGAVICDKETGAWTSFVQNVGGKFTACSSCLAWGGKLRLATQGWEYTVDPASDKIERRRGPTGANDPRDKLFVLSGRLFWAGKVSNRMKVYERMGGWFEMADLQDFPMASAGGEWGLIQDYSRVALGFYTGLKNYDVFDRYYATFLLEATSIDPLSALTVTDKSESAPFGIVVPIPLTTAVVTGCNESDRLFLASNESTFFFAGGSAVTSSVHPVNRLRDAVRLAPLTAPGYTALGGQANGSIAWVSSRYGMQDTILNRNERIQPYKVEVEPGFPRRLRIHYVGHTVQALGTQMSVRIYYRDLLTPGSTGREGSPHPLKAGTIANTPALINGYDAPNGFNNVAQKRIDNVPLTQVGEDHYVVWDLEADLGADYSGPLPPFQLLMNFPGSLPPL